MMDALFRDSLQNIITSEVRGRTQFIANDCRTIRHARTQDWFAQGEGTLQKAGFGRGNFLMAHGLFSILNLQGYVLSTLESCGTNNTEYFRLLVKHLPGSVNLGLCENDADHVWKIFRDKLAHLASPLAVVETFSDESASEGNYPVFRQQTGRWHCNVDRLASAVLEIAEWLCKRVESISDIKALSKLAQHLRPTALTLKPGSTTVSASVMNWKP